MSKESSIEKFCDKKFCVSKTSVEVDEYIEQFSPDIQKILTKIRKTIRKAAPKAVEKISYRMPSFFQKKTLVYFAAMKNHIGFYPTGDGVAFFTDELADYKTSKGAIQFPFSKPIPYDLIERITQFRVQQVEELSGPSWT